MDIKMIDAYLAKVQEALDTALESKDYWEDPETKVRHIRTPEGERRFGGRIGDVITADMVNRASSTSAVTARIRGRASNTPISLRAAKKPRTQPTPKGHPKGFEYQGDGFYERTDGDYRLEMTDEGEDGFTYMIRDMSNGRAFGRVVARGGTNTAAEAITRMNNAMAKDKKPKNSTAAAHSAAFSGGAPKGFTHKVGSNGREWFGSDTYNGSMTENDGKWNASYNFYDPPKLGGDIRRDFDTPEEAAAWLDKTHANNVRLYSNRGYTMPDTASPATTGRPAAPPKRSPQYEIASRGLRTGKRAGVTAALNAMPEDEFQAFYTSLSTSYQNAQDMRKIKMLATSVGIMERVAAKRKIKLTPGSYYGMNWDSVSLEIKDAMGAMVDAGTHEWVEDPEYDGVEALIETGTNTAVAVIYRDGTVDLDAGLEAQFAE